MTPKRTKAKRWWYFCCWTLYRANARDCQFWSRHRTSWRPSCYVDKSELDADPIQSPITPSAARRLFPEAFPAAFRKGSK